jgi:mannose PTS system EIID component
VSVLVTSARLRSFLRTFLIQGSWNYRSLIGSGLAYALLPMLRVKFRGEPDQLSSAVRRHVQPFNAHPYLSGIAAGAVVRLEEEGADPEMIGRFKDAIQGSLGSLGDGLVWAGFRPLVALLALFAAFAGAPPYVVIGLFLVLYNIGHLWLRVWSFLIGLQGGHHVVERVRAADLPGLTRKTLAAGSFTLGALIGLFVLDGRSLGAGLWPWLLVSAVGFAVGHRVGYSAWRPTAVLTALAVLVLSILGLE